MSNKLWLAAVVLSFVAGIGMTFGPVASAIEMEILRDAAQPLRCTCSCDGDTAVLHVEPERVEK